MAEVKKLCKNAERSQIHQCIQQHFAEFSGECQRLAKAQKEKASPPRRAAAPKPRPQGSPNPATQQKCMAEVKKLCKNAERSQIHQCIQQHFTEFSAECQRLAKAQKANQAR